MSNRTRMGCDHCRRRLTVDEVLNFTDHCEDCVNLLRRRWDDRYSAQPSKFTQRLAIILAIAIIAACVVAMKHFSGGAH